MDLRRVTGYIALALLAGYWVWVLSRTSPELRRGTRDRVLRGKILLVKTAAVVLTALVVATIHFWATAVWHVLVTVPVAIGVGYLLRRAYRRLVAIPRHRLPLAQRVRRTGQLHVIAPPHARPAAHRVVARTVVPAPRRTAETVRPWIPVTLASGPVPALGAVPVSGGAPVSGIAPVLDAAPVTDGIPLSPQVTGPVPT